MPSAFPRIFLSGFMGSGKSTLGKKLSLLLNRDFYDLDVLIEQKTGLSIPDIFKEQGEPTFRAIEQEVLKDLAQRQEQFVCSLGGGSICNENSLALVKKSGILIYIDLPAEALAERLRDRTEHRPLLQSTEKISLTEKIQLLLNERESYYSRADLKVDGTSLNSRLLLDKILEIKKK